MSDSAHHTFFENDSGDEDLCSHGSFPQGGSSHELTQEEMEYLYGHANMDSFVTKDSVWEDFVRDFSPVDCVEEDAAEDRLPDDEWAYDCTTDSLGVAASKPEDLALQDCGDMDLASKENESEKFWQDSHSQGSSDITNMKTEDHAKGNVTEDGGREGYPSSDFTKIGPRKPDYSEVCGNFGSPRESSRECYTTDDLKKMVSVWEAFLRELLTKDESPPDQPKQKDSVSTQQCSEQHEDEDPSAGDCVALSVLQGACARDDTVSEDTTRRCLLKSGLSGTSLKDGTQISDARSEPKTAWEDFVEHHFTQDGLIHEDFTERAEGEEELLSSEVTRADDE